MLQLALRFSVEFIRTWHMNIIGLERTRISNLRYNLNLQVHSKRQQTHKLGINEGAGNVLARRG